MADKKTKFNQKWLHIPEFSWVAEVPNQSNNAHCQICNTTFSLSNMGKQALTSHMNGKKHGNIIKDRNSCQPVSMTFVATTTDVTSHPGTTADLNSTAHTLTSASDTPLGKPTALESTKSPLMQSQTSNEQSDRINHFLIKDEVSKAEIIWCLKAVMNHNSLRDIENSVSAMKLIFPDSKIVGEMKLRKDKAAYTISYGLNNYFQNELINKIDKSEYVVILFDESLNKVCQNIVYFNFISKIETVFF